MPIYLASLVAGLCLGWLVGLSISPVIGAVVGTALSALIGVVVAVQGSSTDEVSNQAYRFLATLKIQPLVWLLVGIAIGAALGIFTRTHDLLGRTDLSPEAAQQQKFDSVRREIEFWLDLSDGEGPNREEILKGLFESSLKISTTRLAHDKSNSKETTVDKSSSKGTTVLFSESGSTCKILARANGDDLVSQLKLINSEAVTRFVEGVDQDETALRALVENFLCPSET